MTTLQQQKRFKGLEKTIEILKRELVIDFGIDSFPYVIYLKDKELNSTINSYIAVIEVNRDEYELLKEVFDCE